MRLEKLINQRDVMEDMNTRKRKIGYREAISLENGEKLTALIKPNKKVEMNI